MNAFGIDFFGRFANVEMMQQYGILLESFLENGEFVNDCILTMMYHVGGELGEVMALFQPVILKTFSKIWETEYELCDVSLNIFIMFFVCSGILAKHFSDIPQDWSDLIFYSMTKFISTPQKPTINLSAPSLIASNRIEDQIEKSIW